MVESISGHWRLFSIVFMGLLAWPVSAQEIPIPPKNKGPRLVLPEQEGKKQVPRPEPVNFDLEKFGKVLAQVALYSPKSTRSRRLLAELMQESESRLLELLGQVWVKGNKAQVLGGIQLVRVLGTQKAAASLRASLANNRYPGNLVPALQVLVKIDRVASKPIFLKCLESKVAKARREAAGILRSMVVDGDLENLARLSRSERVDTRRRAIDLLGRIKAPGRGDVLAACLNDVQRANRRMAAGEVSRLGAFPAGALKMIMAGPGSGNAFPYALLAALDSKVRTLAPEMAPMFKQGMALSDDFLATLCAAALVRLSYYSADLTGKLFAENKAVDRLVSELSRVNFYNGRQSAFRVASAALRLLTGENRSPAGWSSWWKREAGVFAGNRASLPLDKVEFRQQTVVILADSVEVFILRPMGNEWRGPVDSHLVTLEKQRQAELVASLCKAGLEKRATPLKDKAFLSITLRLQGREQVMIGAPDDPGLQRLAGLIRDEVECNLWQLFGPSDPVKRKQWFAETAKYFIAASDQEKQLKLKELVLLDLPRRKGARLVRGLGYLLAIPGIEKMMKPVDLDLLFSCIKDEQQVTGRVVPVLEVIAMVPGVEAWTKILAYVNQRWDNGGAGVFQKLLVRANPERVVHALEFDSTNICSAVIRFIGINGQRRWAGRLVPLLDSPIARVRASAIWALGQLKVFATLSKVVRAAMEDVSVEVRYQAIIYLGRSGRPNVVVVLQEALNSSVVQLQLAAVKAMGLSRQVAAIDMLTAYMAAMPKGLVSRQAETVLADWGGPLVRRSVRANLKTRRPEVRLATVMLLGRLLDPVAIPYLVQGLRDPQMRGELVTLRRFLCGITCMPSGGDSADFYTNWFNANRKTSQAKWYLDALRRSGYKFSFTEQDLLPGAGYGAVAQLAKLLRRIDQWYLRVHTAHCLREITGNSFGQVWDLVEPGEAAVVSEAWLGWLQMEKEKEEGK